MTFSVFRPWGNQGRLSKYQKIQASTFSDPEILFKEVCKTTILQASSTFLKSQTGLLPFFQHILLKCTFNRPGVAGAVL